MSDLAATPDNFAAQLAASDAEASASPGADGDDSGDNSSGSEPSFSHDDISSDLGNPLNPHQSDELDGSDVTDAQDTPRDDDQEGDEYTDDEQGGEDQPAEGGLTFEQFQNDILPQLQSETLPDWLLDRKVTVTEDGREYQVPVGELTKGYMRMRNYSRGKAESAEAMRNAQAVLGNMRQITDSWRSSPDAIIAGMKRLGASKAFDEAVMKRGAELHQLYQMTPEQRALYDKEQAIAAKEEQLRAQEERLKRQQPSPFEQMRPQMEAQLTQHVPALFEHYGIHQNPVSLGVLGTHMQAIWDSKPETFQQALMQATEATAQEMQRLAELYAGYQPQAPAPSQMPRVQPQAPQQQQALGPRRLPPGNHNAPRQRGTVRTGGTPGDFDALMKHRHRMGM